MQFHTIATITQDTATHKNPRNSGRVQTPMVQRFDEQFEAVVAQTQGSQLHGSQVQMPHLHGSHRQLRHLHIVATSPLPHVLPFEHPSLLVLEGVSIFRCARVAFCFPEKNRKFSHFLMQNQSEWVVVDDALADAQSVSSIFQSDETFMQDDVLDPRGKLDVELLVASCTQSQLVKPLVLNLLYEVTRLRRANKDLHVQLMNWDETRMEKVRWCCNLWRAFQYIIGWLLSLLPSIESPREYPRFINTDFHWFNVAVRSAFLLAKTPGLSIRIDPSFGRTAAWPLRARGLVGCIYKPDPGTLSARRLAGVRAVWVRAGT